jgi:YrbI family 3-deoxy-D-manno-octulosonate 8-phosphate phosphatase
MSVVAIIPARGGSKGVPGKNLRRVGGVPLIVRAVDAARSSRLVDRVIVTTDDPRIAAAARSAGAQIVDRPAWLSGDQASSDSALLHALDQLGGDPEVLVFIQATSPFVNAAEFDEAIERVRSGWEDVVFSANETYAYLWQLSDIGATGVNHEASMRLRRQDREPHYQETGAFYVMRTAGFREAGFRFFGRVGVTVVDGRTAIEIDSQDELELANALAPLLDPSLDGRTITVDAVVTDFDGVHTDDRVLVGADGSEFVTTSRADGLGVQLLRECGIPVLILSAETNPVVAARAAKLRVDVLQGITDKAAALEAWADAKGIELDRVAYLGNDINDLGCLELVGWPIAVPGAVPEVIAAARVVLETPGGYGAVRELADRVARPQRSHTQEEREKPWLYPSVTTR